MELPIIQLAYAASALVAVLTTALFSQAIGRVLTSLILDDMSSAWILFVRFALLVTTFVGGMPASDMGKFVGFAVPVVVPPIAGDGTLFVMKSVGAALMSASWFLLVFFGVTLTVAAAMRDFAAVRAKRAGDELAAEAERQETIALNKTSRKEPPAPENRRPVQKEEVPAVTVPAAPLRR